MKRGVGVVGLLAFGLHLWAGPGQVKSGDALSLPDAFANYKEWTQLLKSPYQVPLDLWVRCMAPTPAEWNAARRKCGPHTERYIRVYGNRLAVEAAGATALFPVGAVIAKEKLLSSPHGSVAGVAFMVKRASSAFGASGGWEFLYFPASGDASRTHEACASCHRAAASKDYIFGPT
jgi:hypothetical protein